MANSQEVQKSKVWSIEYDLDTLKAIGDSVTQGFENLTEGGVEVGGLLLGTYTGEALRIEGFEPLRRGRVSGGSFAFSEEDEDALGERMRYHEGRAARGLGHQVLGWYHSHTKKGLGLGTYD